MKAYGSCLYLRSQDASGNILVRLVASRSKVAPLKTQSLPRLELCGALLGTQLCQKVCEAIRFHGKPYFWTDSTCVLRWIAATPATWTTFVANRVSKIQGLSDGCHWGHVKGTENPADLISRGLNAANIIDHDMWWTEPYWLQNAPEQYPVRGVETNEDGEEERRRCAVVNTASTCDEFNQWYISKFDSYDDLIRRTAYWLRMMDLLKLPKDKRKNTDFLSITERKAAEQVLIRRVQMESFPEEWKALSKGSAVSARSPLRWFHPYISEQDGLLRIGGRLNKSQEPEDKKHPPILPARHIFTRKLLQSYHERLLHAAPQLLLSTVRLHYWPLGGRALARQLVHNCLRCYRSKPSTVQQLMGDLPSSRVTVSRPFSRVGVDYFGPVYVRPGPRRAAVKSYVALFVCFCTKAIHMELVTDLSTERFLQALRRFISRRGKPSEIFSDNGTNFVGASNQLTELFDLLRNRACRDKISKECNSEGIQWHFSPPSGPHFGGLWEAGVRSAKKHLLKVLGENVLTFEDMNTLIVQIEGCLNSRPLTQLTEDPEDLTPLTPAHFLIGSPLQKLPDPDYTEVPVNRLKQWHAVQQKFQHFWKRWKRDYLAQLHGRMKRWKPPVEIQIGKLVVIQDDNQPPLRWKMARIHQLHPGDDGIVSVVTLKTSNGFLKRPVERICLLPLPTQDDEIQH